MGLIFDFVFKSVEIGGKRGGGYNLSTGRIDHPPKGSGKKSPKVKTKTQIRKGKK